VSHGIGQCVSQVASSKGQAERTSHGPGAGTGKAGNGHGGH
jgi:hypothetical protein